MSGHLKKLAQSRFASLRLHGPDQKGIVAAYSQILDRHGCSILKSEQCTDLNLNHLFSRSVFFPPLINEGEANDFVTEKKMAIESEMDHLRNSFGLNMIKINWRERPKRMAVFVSKYDHCLWEILLRHEAKELDCDISIILSNHPDLQSVSETFGVPFKLFPINPRNKAEQESKEISLLKRELDVDVIVLARYMQVLSDNFLDSFAHDQIINIHHSFLPAFMGGRPYQRAYERGVKLIGATAHYVTQELDEGPIIDQDVIRVSHRDSISDLVRKGRIIERSVLVNAIQAHLEDRVIAYKNRCVVFNE